MQSNNFYLALFSYVCCLFSPSFAAPAVAIRSSLDLPTSFNVTYLFTANLELGNPPSGISQKPITIPGGVRVPEPILNGTVSGPYINATITSGLAAPEIYNNGTLQVAVIDLYGITTDGYPLHIHETGIGSPSAQVTRIVSLFHFPVLAGS